MVKTSVNTFDYLCFLTGGNICLRDNNMFSQKNLSNFTNKLATAMLLKPILNNQHLCNSAHLVYNRKHGMVLLL